MPALAASRAGLLMPFLLWGCQSSGQAGPRTAENGPMIDFVAPDKGARWTVRAADGSELCSLPCKGRVGDDSGYFLQREPDETHGKLRIDLPAKLGPGPGEVRAVPHAGRGSPVAAVATGVVSLAAIVTGIVFVGAGDTRQCQYEAGSDFSISNIGTHASSPLRPATADGPCSATKPPQGFLPKDGEDIGRSAEANRNVGLVIAGVGLLGAGLSVAWWSWSDSSRIDLSAAPKQGAAPVLRLGPGFAQGTFLPPTRRGLRPPPGPPASAGSPFPDRS